jgi:hypothetical protein
MVLSKIRDNIAAYKKWLLQIKQHPFLYKWETVQHFQLHWNPADPDPAGMFDRSLQNSETRRLWQAGNWQPKRMLLEFWRLEPMTVRAMFDDLFNEQFAPENRISRFVFGCDNLLADYKKAHPTTIENNHYHDDYRAPALYLALHSPELYAPYDFQVFREALSRLGARDIPEVNDTGRYFKVLRTLMTFLDKDSGVAPAMQRHLVPHRHFQGRTLLVSEDFCRFVIG